MNYILTGVISVLISVITTLVITSDRDYAGGVMVVKWTDISLKCGRNQVRLRRYSPQVD